MTDFACTVPQLSIIVPILNESDELPLFFADLVRQQQVDFELLICDGGSSDGSLAWLEQQREEFPWLRVCHGPPGRGRQLNLGLAQARCDWLLLLHVDSRFSDPLALRKSLDGMIALPSRSVAGHFSLKFRRDDREGERAYYYYEWKARLGREETIHGDQGFLLHRSLIDRVGRFDETLTVMEDTDFSDRLRESGQWRLFEAEISTSARRFEVEGMWQRQLLGALIMCFRVIGWRDFFTEAPGIYRQQDRADKLKILPFLKLIRRLLRELPVFERWKLWYASGSYVRPHAWQLFLAIDSWRAGRAGFAVGQGRTRWLETLFPVYTFLTDNLLGRLSATLLLRFWFEMTILVLAKREK